MLHQLMDQIMPKMPHETDGLIFQPLKDVSIRVLPFLWYYRSLYGPWTPQGMNNLKTLQKISYQILEYVQIFEQVL